MQKKLQIKAGNISHLTDARYFAALGVQWLGFNFKKNKANALTLEDAKTIKNWITGPTIVAEFDTMDIDFIFERCHQLQTNWIQIPPQKNLHNLHQAYQIIQIYNNTNFSKEASTHMKFAQLPMQSVEQINAALSVTPQIIFKIHQNLELTKHLIKNTRLTSIEIQGNNENEVGKKSFEELNELFDWMEANTYL